MKNSLYYFTCPSRAALLAVLTYLHELGYVGDDNGDAPSCLTDDTSINTFLEAKHLLLDTNEGLLQGYTNEDGITVECHTIPWYNIFQILAIKPIVKSISIRLLDDTQAKITRDTFEISCHIKADHFSFDSSKIPELMKAYQTLNHDVRTATYWKDVKAGKYD